MIIGRIAGNLIERMAIRSRARKGRFRDYLLFQEVGYRIKFDISTQYLNSPLGGHGNEIVRSTKKLVGNV